MQGSGGAVSITEEKIQYNWWYCKLLKRLLQKKNFLFVSSNALSLFHKDNLYDKAARKGTIYQKLRYAKRKFKEEVNKSGTKQRKMSSSNMESSDETDDEKAADFIEFVKKCKLPRDTTTIKRAFEETIILRQTMMRNLEKYKPLLDLLLLSPDLVIFIVLSKDGTGYLSIFYLILLHRFCSISICDFRPSTAKPCH